MQAQQKSRPAATKPKVPPMPVQARTQEEAAALAKEAYSAQPKASAKTGRGFFERLRPEKVVGSQKFTQALCLTLSKRQDSWCQLHCTYTLIPDLWQGDALDY